MIMFKSIIFRQRFVLVLLVLGVAYLAHFLYPLIHPEWVVFREAENYYNAENWVKAAPLYEKSIQLHLKYPLNGATFESLSYFPFQPVQPTEREKYLVIFDADMNPFPDFVEPLCEYLEKNPKVAFVQTPQYYSNFESNRVAKAAGLQQAIFYEYICEGKGLKDAMFCCGSNVMIRIEALLSVGGFNEVSVTEDFATSLLLHLNGWKSIYFNRVSAFGKGPEDLGSFFKQQFRWARGTLEIARELPGIMWKNYRKWSLGDGGNI